MRFLGVFACLVAACAQTPGDQKTAVVEGTVVNSVSGAALRRVDVTLSNSVVPAELAAMMQKVQGISGMPDMPKAATKTFTATTDGAGKFRFEKVDPGVYYLKAKRAGFVDGSYQPKGGGAEGEMRLSAGQEMTGLVFRLVPQGAISGRVLDEEGEPVPEATVSAMKYSYAAGRRRLTPAGMERTDDRGQFRLGKLPPGKYFLCAELMRIDPMGLAPPAPADGSPETAYVATYYPGTLDLSQAARVEVGPGGDVAGFNIRLQKSRVVRVKGKLALADAAPGQITQIMVMPGGGRIGGMSMTMVSDPEGKFELTNLQPGNYTVMVMRMSGSNPTVNIQPLVVPSQGLQDVKLGNQPEGTIQGSIMVEGDAKIPLKGFSIMLAPGEGLSVMPVTGTADENGGFTLKHLAAAPYDLALTSVPGGAYVKSVAFNGRDAMGKELECPPGGNATLRIVLGTDGGQVEATVSREDKAVSDATVVLLPAEPDRRHEEAVRKGSTDAAGKTTLKDIPPGDYLAFAWEKVEDDAWFDPEFLKSIESRAVKVRVGSKGKETVELKAIPGTD